MSESAHLIGTNPQIMGILNVPQELTDAGERTAVVMLSSGLLHRVGPFRLHVDLARALARIGIMSFRIDQAGRGDSSRSEGMTAGETIQAELAIVREFLAGSQGVDNVVLVGLCSGADDALELARHNAFVKGIVLLDGFAARTPWYYIAYYGQRILDPVRLGNIIKSRLKRLTAKSSGSGDNRNVEFEELAGIRNLSTVDDARTAFGALFERDGHALCVFTGGVKEYYCYQGQLRKNLKNRTSKVWLTEVFYPSANHTYPMVKHRNELVELIISWIADRFTSRVNNKN